MTSGTHVNSQSNANDKIKLMKYKNNYRKDQRERCFPPHVDKMATTRKPRLAKYYQQPESGPKAALQEALLDIIIV